MLANVLCWYNDFSLCVCVLQESVDLGEIMFSLCYLPTAGRLTLTVIKCRNLKAMDITGYSGRFSVTHFTAMKHLNTALSVIILGQWSLVQFIVHSQGMKRYLWKKGSYYPDSFVSTASLIVLGKKTCDMMQETILSSNTKKLSRFLVNNISYSRHFYFYPVCKRFSFAVKLNSHSLDNIY